MSRVKIRIPVKELKRLYHEERLSPAKIGKEFGCHAVTVRNRLIEAGIALKTKSLAQTRYGRTDFDGDDNAKAYILGFRYGDLNAYQPPGASETIVVRSHSTLDAQHELFQSLFGKYGRVTVSSNSRSTQMTCYLNTSFSFLLKKYPPQLRSWILSDDIRHWSFAAGYIDAEGTFGLNQGRGRFKMDAYDCVILNDLHELFVRHGINSKLRIIARKGENDYGWVWKEDLWRLSVNEMRSLEVLLENLMPRLRHRKRVEDAKIVLRNIGARRQRKHGATS